MAEHMAEPQTNPSEPAAEETPGLIPPDQVILAYCHGYFPMGVSRDDPTVHWYYPQVRAVMPLDGLKISRSLLKVIKSGHFEFRIDTAFAQVIAACAEPRSYEQQTWINRTIERTYIELHKLGVAHSVEAWREGRLVGGLYGVALGGAFFGESMFHRADMGGRDASKACLWRLVEHLNGRGYVLLDTQIMNDHMARLGAVGVEQDRFGPMLQTALNMDVTWADE